MKRILLVLICAMISLIILSGSVLAQSYDLPTVLVGQTTVEQKKADGTVLRYYGGFTGNEVVFNSYPDLLLGFDKTVLQPGGDCYEGKIASVLPSCFTLDWPAGVAGDSQAVGIMQSRTLVGSTPVLDLAALFYRPQIAMGDIYSSDDFLDNFRLYGRNLGQNAAGSNTWGATWGFKQYKLNPESQSAWIYNGSETEPFKGFKSKVYALSGDGAALDGAAILPLAGGSVSWHLQVSNQADFTTGTGAGDDQYNTPDGRVWVINDDLNIPDNAAATYLGLGTIIVQGNINIGAGARIKSETEDGLGLIAINKADGTGGNCTFGGRNDVRAMVFCLNNAIIPAGRSNVKLAGSLVAKTFDIQDSSSNIQFFYDYGLAKIMPPGFRYLGIPTVTETK